MSSRSRSPTDPESQTVILNLLISTSALVVFAKRSTLSASPQAVCSQIVMALYRAVSRNDNRLVDLTVHRELAKAITGYEIP